MKNLLYITTLALVITGCTDSDKTCDPACGEGQTCDTSSGQCVANLEECSATVPHSCSGLDEYCKDGVCERCVGRFNCDGVDSCECDSGCDGESCKEGPCDPDALQDCGDNELFCNENLECQACPTNSYNCDGVGDDCECAGGCNGTECKTSTDGGGDSSYTTDGCPATSRAVTAERTVEGETSVQGIGDHCMLTDPYYQAIKIELSERSKVRVRVTTGGDFAASLRSECAVDHGCAVGNPYARDLDPGTYNLIVATADPASYSVLIEFLAPDPEEQ